jgi:hypothetical protein
MSRQVDRKAWKKDFAAFQKYREILAQAEAVWLREFLLRRLRELEARWPGRGIVMAGVPKTPGFYWARFKENEWGPVAFTDWRPVQVAYFWGESGNELGVYVFGQDFTSELDELEWGPEILLPEVLHG